MLDVADTTAGQGHDGDRRSNRRLVLFDRAYFKYRRFALIDENDGYFVSRLKQNANPVITAELREWRGRAIPLEGKQIHDVVNDLSRKYSTGASNRPPRTARPVRGNSDAGHDACLPVVGVRDEDADVYHLYTATSCPARSSPRISRAVSVPTGETAVLVELKTQYELDEFDTNNPDVVKILLYAALLSLLVSRELLDLVTEQADDEIVFPPERWAATFRSHARYTRRNSVSISETAQG